MRRKWKLKHLYRVYTVWFVQPLFLFLGWIGVERLLTLIFFSQSVMTKHECVHRTHTHTENNWKGNKKWAFWGWGRRSEPWNKTWAHAVAVCLLTWLTTSSAREHLTGRPANWPMVCRVWVASTHEASLTHSHSVLFLHIRVALVFFVTWEEESELGHMHTAVQPKLAYGRNTPWESWYVMCFILFHIFHY